MHIASHYLLLVLIGFVGLSGCASTEPDEPTTTVALPTISATMPGQLPLPEFIWWLYPVPGATGALLESVCLELNPAAIWEPGDEYENLSRQISSSFELRLDDVIMPKRDLNFFSAGNEILVSKNGSTGSVAAGLPVLNRIDLAIGLHTASIHLTSTSGMEYSYSWSFRADEIHPSRGDHVLDLANDCLDAKEAASAASYRTPEA
jgi:hypothetical protein